MSDRVLLGGKSVQGFALGDDGVQRFRVVLDELLSNIERFTRDLTPREMTILRLGLEASHLEESTAQGDWTRARAHAEKITQLLDRLGSEVSARD